jgi:phosphate-selective porin OprO/OprP
MRALRITVALFFTALLSASPILAEDAEEVDVAALVRRLEAAEERIQQLERQLQAQRPTAAEAHASEQPNLDLTADKPTPAVSKPQSKSKPDEPAPAGDKKQGFLNVSTEKFTVRVGGRVDGDYINFLSQDGANKTALGDLDDHFEFRRLRLGAEGEGFGVFDYKLEVDFEPENEFTVLGPAGTPITIGTEAVAIRDVYMGIKEVPYLGHVRFGHFKAPISLEELTSSRFITFLERALPNALVPSREVGFAASNHTENERLTFTSGIFFDDISETLKERINDDQGLLVATRLTALPWYDSDGRYLLHWGGSYSYTNDNNDSVTFSTRPELHEEVNFLSTGLLAVRDYHRWGGETALVFGPASLQSEVVWVNADPLAGANLNLWGAYVYASYFLTGEHRPYRKEYGVFDRVIPLENFWIVRTNPGISRGWGAWETAVRWSYLDLDDAGIGAASRGELHDITLGLNWYWNPNMKLMFNYIHAFNDRADVGDNDADIVALRMHVDF